MLIDLVIFLALCLGIILGWQQGLFRFVKKILPTLGSLIITVVTFNFFSKLVFDSSLGTILNDWLKSLFGNFSEYINAPIILQDEHLFLQTATGTIPLLDVLKDAGFSVFSGTIESIAMKLTYLDSTFLLDGTMSMGDAFIPRITVLICFVITFLAEYIVMAIILVIVRKIVVKVIKYNKPVQYFDKFLGVIVWATLILFIVYLLFAILTLFESNEAVAPLMEYISNSSIADVMYKNNILILVVKGIAEYFSIPI